MVLPPAAAQTASAPEGPTIVRLAPSAPASAPYLVELPRISGRLHAADIGLVINRADPYSVAVGEHYIAARHLRADQVLRVDLPPKAVLSRSEFATLERAIASRFGARTQALALAWAAPYAVVCNSITGALALGFDAELCSNGCAASRPSPYFNSPSPRPLLAHGLRPAMLIAARSVEQAKSLIDRGVAADGSLALRGRPPVTALLLTTDDAARGVRSRLYPPPVAMRAVGVDIEVAPAARLAQARRIVLALTGSVRVALDPPPDWAPGAIGDHLTSTGGDLQGTHGHTTALDWIESGVVATHGAVSEPCNHLQKFPHPQVLLGHYVQGATAIEAYWKSVAWPQQSLFVGEPLAAPFARR